MTQPQVTSAAGTDHGIPFPEHSGDQHKKARRKRPTSGLRMNVSSACTGCRQRRRKCTGEQPCEPCIFAKTKCTYDKAVDKRCKDYGDRTRAESDFQRHVLASLLLAIKTQNPRRIFELVRQNVSMDILAAELDNLNGTCMSMSPSTNARSSPNTPSSTMDTPPPPLSMPLSFQPHQENPPYTISLSHHVQRKTTIVRSNQSLNTSAQYLQEIVSDTNVDQTSNASQNTGIYDFHQTPPTLHTATASPLRFNNGRVTHGDSDNNSTTAATTLPPFHQLLAFVPADQMISIP